MTKRCLASLAAFVFAAALAPVAAAHADQPQLVTINPDCIRKGATPSITIALDKSVPHQDQIANVVIGAKSIPVNPPGPDGKLTVQLPDLQTVGQVDVDILAKDNTTLAVGKLTFTDSALPNAPQQAPSHTQLHLLLLYVLLLVSLPFICTIYDIRRSYQERKVVLDKLPDHATMDHVAALLGKMDQGPTGLTGLTRGLIAITLVLALAIAAFHLIVFAPTGLPDIADKLIMLLAGTLTAITGFYFGAKAASEGTPQKTPDNGGAKPGTATPTINAAQWAAANRQLTITGAGFGAQQGHGSVTIGNAAGVVAPGDWTDGRIVATVPPGVQGDVNVVVNNDAGAASAPFRTNIP
ncbi:MAG: IPT/TIG domain-containing protein [Terracidiphilus sp.]